LGNLLQIVTHFYLKSSKLSEYQTETMDCELSLPTELVAGSDVELFLHVKCFVAVANCRPDPRASVTRLVILQELCVTEHSFAPVITLSNGATRQRELSRYLKVLNILRQF